MDGDGHVEGVVDAEALTAIFGYWPSFHDAEVLALRLDRRDGDPDGPSLEADIHVFEMTDEVAADGFYVLRHHTVVTLRFVDARVSVLSGFNRQNVLAGLDIAPVLDDRDADGPRVAVDLVPAYGVAAELDCSRVEVRDVRPFEPPPR